MRVIDEFGFRQKVSSFVLVLSGFIIAYFTSQLVGVADWGQRLRE